MLTDQKKLSSSNNEKRACGEQIRLETATSSSKRALSRRVCKAAHRVRVSWITSLFHIQLDDSIPVSPRSSPGDIETSSSLDETKQNQTEAHRLFNLFLVFRSCLTVFNTPSRPASKYRLEPLPADLTALSNIWKPTSYSIDRCEERIVMSAIPLIDLNQHVLDSNTTYDSNQNTSVGNLQVSNAPTSAVVSDAPPLEANASLAHEQTHWTDVQQSYGLRGDRQTVAIIDTGIAYDHVALGKGFGPGYRVVGGWDFAENDANPYDDKPAGFHGTHVAGIVGAKDATRSGVASEVDLVALRVFDDAGKGSLEWTEKALQWVHQNRNSFESPITTVNLSIGSTWNSDTVPSWGVLEDELLQLQQDGIVVVASAGNSFKQYNAPGLSYPAASPTVIPVASIDSNGSLSDFSQRNERVIAAPGRSILSTVPDHVLGSDGVVNDWTTATGTSMAAPYVAGSAVLIRQAMEIAGLSNITPQSIYQVLQDTSDSVWDSITNAAYDRLNLGAAINSIIPADNIGDSWHAAQEFQLHSLTTTNGWVNTLGDADAFRFTATGNGTVSVSMQSDWVAGGNWSLMQDGQVVSLADPSVAQFNIQAGHTYALAFGDSDSIGSFKLNWTYTASSTNDTSTDNGSSSSSTNLTPVHLGSTDYREVAVNDNRIYQVHAANNGLLTVVLQSPSSASGALELRSNTGQVFQDATFSNGEWRIDIDAAAGSDWTVKLPSGTSPQSQLIIGNLLQQQGTTVNVLGTNDSDIVGIDLADGVDVQIGKIKYEFASSSVSKVHVDLESGNDQVNIRGSAGVESVNLSLDQSKVVNQRMTIEMISTENVAFDGGGGPDSVSMAGSNGDDTLTARPNQVELVGPAFSFRATNVERTYVSANQGGSDIAYLYDSTNDDRLSVRPQFSSMSGSGFFNYAAGFERVYAYALNGGVDSASLYDSTGSDTFYTSGDVASIVGAGFFSYTKFFENVEATSSNGGADVASVYASDKNSILVASDFTGYQDAGFSRIARGFASAKTYVDNQLIDTKSFSNALVDTVDSQSVTATIETTQAADVASPEALIVDTATPNASRSLNPLPVQSLSPTFPSEFVENESILATTEGPLRGTASTINSQVLSELVQQSIVGTEYEFLHRSVDMNAFHHSSTDDAAEASPMDASKQTSRIQSEYELAEAIHQEMEATQDELRFLNDHDNENAWIADTTHHRGQELANSLPFIALATERKILDHIFAEHGQS